MIWAGSMRGRKLLGRGEDVAEGLEGVGRVVGGQVVEGDDLHDRAQAGEVGVDLDPLEVADDQERRVAEVVLVAQQLDVGGLQVLVLALVLPGEEVALPDVGEAVAAGGLGDALLEGVLGAGGVGLVGGRLAEHPAQVDEVLLGGGLLRGRHAAPLRRERAGCQGRLGRHAPLPSPAARGRLMAGVYVRPCGGCARARPGVSILRRPDPAPDATGTISCMAATSPECPTCGAPTIRKSVRKGRRAGLEIWSCSRYPACSGLINIDSEPPHPDGSAPATHPGDPKPGAYMQARFERERERTLLRRRALLPAFAASAILLMAIAFFGLQSLGAPLAGLGAVAVGALAAVGLWRLPFESLVWARGIEGERRAADYLAPLQAESFIVLHNRRVPSAKGDIDHIVIGPTGIVVIETKNWSGKAHVVRDRLFVGETERTWAVDQLYREATAVQIALGDELSPPRRDRDSDPPSRRRRRRRQRVDRRRPPHRRQGPRLLHPEPPAALHRGRGPCTRPDGRRAPSAGVRVGGGRDTLSAR